MGVSFDLSLNFTMVIGSFTQKHVLIQTDQSESREGMYGPIQADQSGSREGMCGYKLTNQNFLIISPCKDTKDESHLLVCQSE